MDKSKEWIRLTGNIFNFHNQIVYHFFSLTLTIQERAGSSFKYSWKVLYGRNYSPVNNELVGVCRVAKVWRMGCKYSQLRQTKWMIWQTLNALYLPIYQ